MQIGTIDRWSERIEERSDGVYFFAFDKRVVEVETNGKFRGGGGGVRVSQWQKKIVKEKYA